MLSEKQKALYRRTIEVALTSPSRKQVGAILLKKNTIVAQATNLEKKTHWAFAPTEVFGSKFNAEMESLQHIICFFSLLAVMLVLVKAAQAKNFMLQEIYFLQETTTIL